MSVQEYQCLIFHKIGSKLNLPIINEWMAFQGYKNQYAPRVDIAVGPYSIKDGVNKGSEYDELLTHNDRVSGFVERIYDFHKQNCTEEYLIEYAIPRLDDMRYSNENARCFFTIEIENKNSKKHIMGSMVNAASLGRIGIGVAYNDSVMRTFLRLLNYLSFLKRVEKNSYNTTNFLVLTAQQLEEALD